MKKELKVVCIVLVSLVIIVGLSGCNENVDSELYGVEDFKGTWSGYFFNDCYSGFTFSENNITCHISEDCRDNYSTDTLTYGYTITNDTLMMYVHGYEYANVNFTIRFEDNKNTLFLTNNDNEYKLVRGGE